MSAVVIVKKLKIPHGQDSFTTYKELNEALVGEINAAVTGIFDSLGGSALLKKSGEVYIKPNAVDSKPYSHTRPEVIRAVIDYWKSRGAKHIFLFENSTQANFTRIVFKAVGYTNICRETGCKPIYLDEEKSTTLSFKGPPSPDNVEHPLYDLAEFAMPATVMKLINEREKHLYINVPKLKTHSMGVVTLGIKNQWGFPMQKSRGFDHNYNLHLKLTDILGYIKPDLTLIEGIEGTIHGHYFATALADKQVKPFLTLLGSANVVAADIAGAGIFGLKIADVPHLKLAVERGFSGGIKSESDIILSGDVTGFSDLYHNPGQPQEKHYPWDLHPQFPADVRLITGQERYCPEGCRNNPLCLLQTLSLDYRGKGGWTLVAGKGHDKEAIESIEGKVLIAGHCAIEEVAEQLTARLGKKNVYLSGECNNLCATAEAMLHLMKVNPLKLVPLDSFTSSAGYLTARLKGSCSRVPHPLSHILKRV